MISRLCSKLRVWHCMAWQDSSRSRSPALGFTALDRPHIDWFSKMDPGSPVSPLVQPTGDKLCCQYPHPAQPSPAKPSPAQLSLYRTFAAYFLRCFGLGIVHSLGTGGEQSQPPVCRNNTRVTPAHGQVSRNFQQKSPRNFATRLSAELDTC